jgi:hypothetical protein
MLHPSHFEVR